MIRNPGSGESSEILGLGSHLRVLHTGRLKSDWLIQLSVLQSFLDLFSLRVHTASDNVLGRFGLGNPHKGGILDSRMY